MGRRRTKSIKVTRIPEDSELVASAGTVKLDPPKICGQAIVSEFKSCVWNHWFDEMVNFNGTLGPQLFIYFEFAFPAYWMAHAFMTLLFF
jgi:hypothetical protein